MAKIIPGHTESEIRKLFADRYGTELTRGQIGNTKTRLGVKSGTHGGRFAKGCTPHNKGRTWDEMGYSEELRESMLANCFKPGHMPANAKDKPVGYERVTRDGYVEVKIAERPSRPFRNDNFKLKHRLVWEQHNGRPVPPGHHIVFADGDKRNFDPDNLVAVSRSDWAVIANSEIEYSDRETLLAAVDIAQLRRGIYAARCRERNCKRCGEEFKPRFAHQRTCDKCLGRE